jgi:hypothetical protein
MKPKEEIEILDEDCKKLAFKILKDIFEPVNTYKITIFLCGAAITQKEKMRFKVAEALSDWWYDSLYDIIYPEDLFDELLYGLRSKDLLSLENMLAESVDAILLIPESPGSFAELGAFANDERLRKKLICIVDKNYKKDKSFINQGPLKLVRQANKHGIIYVDTNEIKKKIDDVHTSLKKMKKSSHKIGGRINLLQIDRFLLPTIYLLEPVTKPTLIKIVGHGTDDRKNSMHTTTAALTMLIKRRQVELTPNGFKLTQIGVKEFFSFRKTHSRKKDPLRTTEIDNLRLEILNLKNRKKKLKV